MNGINTLYAEPSTMNAKDAQAATHEFCYMDAVDLARMIATRAVSAREVMAAFLDQIERVNGAVNAICTQIPAEEALRQAEQADRALANGDSVGPLHGLPIAVKDLALTKGIRTTYGSSVFQDLIPDQDTLYVERLKAAGALIIGKTNTPEFGAGSHTFNPVFGATRNPYDLSRSAGGSSGGAAAALAAGMLPLADGSDMGGSLRNPAAFCNVVGFRPSVGRVPMWPCAMAWQSRIAVEGPMARNVQDCALLLSVMAGPDPRDPLSLSESPEIYREPLVRDFGGSRIAWSRDLGMLPVERAVADCCEQSLGVFRDLGCELETDHPDLSDAMGVFEVLRASFYAQFAKPFLEENRTKIKDTAIWNIEQGFKFSAMDLTEADAKRTAIYHRVLAFFEHYDFLVLPTTQVAPFDCDTEWVKEIEGAGMSTYLDWMRICCVITTTGLPAISVPCGFTPEGLPVGLQIVGKPNRDREVLQLAYAFEQATQYGQQRPVIV